MFSMPTTAQVSQYIRIALYGLAGALGQQAFADGALGSWLITAAVGGGTLLWTMYATRLKAKINELVGAEVITQEVAEKMKDVADDPNKVITTVVAKPAENVS